MRYLKQIKNFIKRLFLTLCKSDDSKESKESKEVKERLKKIRQNDPFLYK